MFSFNFTNCVPIWLLIASMGPQLKFFVLVGFGFGQALWWHPSDCNGKGNLLVGE